jgi:acetolactate synthase-1/3 small subunit
VQDVTHLPAVVRELALIKVHVANTEKRSEIKQIADMFQSRVVDVYTDSLIIEVTGEQDKVDSILLVLEEYGVTEVVRTGRVAMVRGSARVAHTDDAAVAGNGHLN